MNFVTVHIRRVSSGFSVKIMLGGEKSREAQPCPILGLFLKKPNAQANQHICSLIAQSMQKKIGDRSLLEKNTAKTMLKTCHRSYLERIRNRMHEPIEGLSPRNSNVL